MTDHQHPDPAERAAHEETEEAIVALLSRYLERRENGAPPQAHDLLAAAAEFGHAAVGELRTALAFYEAVRAREASSKLSPAHGREAGTTLKQADTLTAWPRTDSHT